MPGGSRCREAGVGRGQSTVDRAVSDAGRGGRRSDDQSRPCRDDGTDPDLVPVLVERIARERLARWPLIATPASPRDVGAAVAGLSRSHSACSEVEVGGPAVVGGCKVLTGARRRPSLDRRVARGSHRVDHSVLTDEGGSHG